MRVLADDKCMYGPIDRYSTPGLYVNQYGNWHAIVPHRTDSGELIYIHNGKLQVSGGGTALYRLLKPLSEVTIS